MEGSSTISKKYIYIFFPKRRRLLKEKFYQNVCAWVFQPIFLGKNPLRKKKRRKEKKITCWSLTKFNLLSGGSIPLHDNKISWIFWQWSSAWPFVLFCWHHIIYIKSYNCFKAIKSKLLSIHLTWIEKRIRSMCTSRV